MSSSGMGRDGDILSPSSLGSPLETSHSTLFHDIVEPLVKDHTKHHIDVVFKEKCILERGRGRYFGGAGPLC